MRLIIISAVYQRTKRRCHLNHRHIEGLTETRRCQLGYIQLALIPYDSFALTRNINTGQITESEVHLIAVITTSSLNRCNVHQGTVA